MADVRSGGGDGVGTLNELKDLLVAYARQETVDPIKALGRYVAFGLAGSVLIGLAGVLLPLALLRALQAETGTTFTGNWSWAPYAITLAVVAIGVLVIILGLKRVKDSQRVRAARSER